MTVLTNQATRAKPFLRYIHNFRGLAISLIVIGHIVPFIDVAHNAAANTFIQGLTINGSVYFVFIAGFLFQFLSHKYAYKSYLGNKFKTVILPYLIISIPAIGLCLLKNQPFYSTSSLVGAFSTWPLLPKIAALYLTGAHFFHFWFVPMIAIFYVFSPALIWLDRHPKFYKILPLLFALSILVSRAKNDGFVLQNFIHFLSIYVLGMFCCHYRDAVLTWMQKYWKISLLAAINLIVLETALTITSSPLHSAVSINTVSKAILSVVFMYLLWRFDSMLPQSLHGAIGKLADLSFGIYFLHGYVIYVCAYLFGKIHLSSTPWFTTMGALSLVLYLSLVMTLTVAVSLGFQRVFGKKSRYLIGC